MNISLMIYLADVVHGLSNFSVGIGIMAFGYLIGWNIVVAINNSESRVEDEMTYLKPKNYLIFATVFVLMGNLLPSQKAIYLIAGAEIGREVISNPQVTETMGKVLKVINKKLDDEISSIKIGGEEKPEKGRKD